jgi:hypothetical protein
VSLTFLQMNPDARQALASARPKVMPDDILLPCYDVAWYMLM